MATLATCHCGFIRQLSDTFAGKIIQCPSCGSDIQCKTAPAYRKPPPDWADEPPTLDHPGRTPAQPTVASHPGAASFHQTAAAMPPHVRAAYADPRGHQPAAGSQFDSQFQKSSAAAVRDGDGNSFLLSLMVLSAGLLAYMLAPEWPHAKTLATGALMMSAITFLSRAIGGRAVIIAAVALGLSGFAVYKIHKTHRAQLMYSGEGHEEAYWTDDDTSFRRSNPYVGEESASVKESRSSVLVWHNESRWNSPEAEATTGRAETYRLDAKQRKKFASLAEITDGLLDWGNQHGGLNAYSLKDATKALGIRGLGDDLKIELIEGEGCGAQDGLTVMVLSSRLASEDALGYAHSCHVSTRDGQTTREHWQQILKPNGTRIQVDHWIQIEE